jgi:hypothetical protein
MNDQAARKSNVIATVIHVSRINLPSVVIAFTKKPTKMKPAATIRKAREFKLATFMRPEAPKRASK